ncbi:MLP-like protein 423 [Neltuma alba]|uniref:MLP-like protein 423 n=1 Tax=Neltuma alba TaxID=207710 RepID=UPI0010A39D81|nr:MLP-like protein 423 [Prosopis alba]XP_028801878.1 MLP-like protein 423 [Prosopis alba]
MAATGKIEVEVEVKSNADKFWQTLRDSSSIFPKALSHDYKSIEVIEGDGKAPGSVRHIFYGEGSPIVKESKEKIEALDDAKKTVTYSVIDGDLLKYFKHFKGHISVTPKGEGSLVKWSSEYEKASEEIADPHVIKDFAAKNFQEVDDYIQKAK